MSRVHPLRRESGAGRAAWMVIMGLIQAALVVWARRTLTVYS